MEGGCGSCTPKSLRHSLASECRDEALGMPVLQNWLDTMLQAFNHGMLQAGVGGHIPNCKGIGKHLFVHRALQTAETWCCGRSPIFALPVLISLVYTKGNMIHSDRAVVYDRTCSSRKLQHLVECSMTTTRPKNTVRCDLLKCRS